MKTRIQAYYTLAEQLALSLPSQKNEVLRGGAWTQILNYLLNSIDVTSAYICRFNPRNNSAVVVGECIMWRANGAEFTSDLGNVYNGSQMGTMLDWIRQSTHQPRILHVDEMEPDDPELEELLTLGAKTVVNLPIYHEGEFWGWHEIWESRAKRYFTENELKIAQKYTELLARMI